MVSGFRKTANLNERGLPDDMAALRKIRSANYPDRNTDADQDLYQAVVEKLDRMRMGDPVNRSLRAVVGSVK